MRLKSFSIKNFKGIGEKGVTIHFSPVTLLFGANNSGKSTIIQALHLAREVICNGNLNPDFVQGGGKAISLGGFQNFVHRHELHREVSFKLEMDIDSLPKYYSDYDNETPVNEEYNAIIDAVVSVVVDVTLAWDSLKGKPFVSVYSVYLNGEHFTKLYLSSNEASAMFSGCNPVMFFPKHTCDDLSEKIDNTFATSETEAFAEIGFEMQDAIEAVTPSILSKFVNYNKLLLSLGATAELSEVFFLPSAPYPLYMSWAEWDNPLDVDDINWWIPDELAESGGDTIDRIEAARTLFSSLILGPGALAANVLSQMDYISSSRVTPDRHFIVDKAQQPDWSDGMAAWKILTENSTLLEKVNNELPLVTGDEFGLLLQHQTEGTFNPRTLATRLENLMTDGEDIDAARMKTLLVDSGTGVRNRLVFLDAWGTDTRPCDLGHGVSQIIPLIVAPLAMESAYTQRLLAIEEPESNIHPAWQVELAEFFLRVAACNGVTGSDAATQGEPVRNDGGNYFGIPPFILLETHSEHIMLRLLRRIRETSEGDLPEGAAVATIHDVAVHYIQKDANGCTEALRMEITPDGDFARQWPKGFFEEREEELF